LVGKANKANPAKYKANANGILKLPSHRIALFSKTVIINATRKNVMTLNVKMIIRLPENSVAL